MPRALTTGRRPAALLAAIALLLAAFAYITVRPAGAGHQPADKVSVAGSTVEVFDAFDEDVTLLSTTMRTSSPADLLLSVTAECSIVTDVTTVGTDDQTAEAKVTVWIEVDGNRVPVAGDNGEVVFCNRKYQRITDLFDDEDATIRTIIDTRAANGFNWLWENAGNGIHTVEVKARFEAEGTDRATASAGVIKRTLVVEPTHMASHPKG